MRKKSITELKSSAKKSFEWFQSGQAAPILDQWPAQELFQCMVGEPNPVDWHSEWIAAGGKIFSGQMVALKNDTIWIRISRFALPYPPFDEFDLMAVRDIDRRTAEALGIIFSGQTIPVFPRNWSEDENHIHPALTKQT